MDSVEFLTACQWKSGLQSLKEFFQFLFGGILNHVVFDFEIVEFIRDNLREIAVECTAKFLCGFLAEREFVTTEIIYR